MPGNDLVATITHCESVATITNCETENDTVTETFDDACASYNDDSYSCSVDD